MITLTGGYGKGTLWGTFYLPNREASGAQGMSLNGHLDTMTPPMDWYLPPPDKKWYALENSPYGPHSQYLDIGSILSVDDRVNEWNPCEHTTLRGDAFYQGVDGTNIPYFRIQNPSSYKTSFQAASGSGEFPVLHQAYLSTLIGRPSTQTSDPKVYSRTGELVNGGWSYSDNFNDYFTTYWRLPGEYTPPHLLSALTQAGVPYRSGQWYAAGYNGGLASSVNQWHYWYKTKWKHPARTTFVREQWYEFHTSQSYTPASSLGHWTKYPYLVEGDHRITTCEITHIRSLAAGHYQIMYNHSTDVSWHGWSPYKYYDSSKKVTTPGLLAAVFILSPGSTPEVVLSTEKANAYCSLAPERATVLYDHVGANSARTAAVNDVQALDSNWIENLAGVKGTMDCINPLIMGYKALKNGDLGAAKKALAGAYLVYQYVIKPGIADYHNIKDSGSKMLDRATTNRFSSERRRGKCVQTNIPVCDTLATLSYFTTYHLRLKDNPFSEIWSAMETLRIDPSAHQIWDLIPFSFVADWFLPLGNTLKNLDAYNSMFLHRDLLGRIETFKVQWPLEEGVLKDLFDDSLCSVGTPIEYSWYDRRVYQSMGVINPIDISHDNGLSSSQMAQGAALLTQMKR